MEFIKHKTINKLELNKENKEKIKNATNSFLRLNMYSLFNKKTVIFHGDPHGGNLYIDDMGNLGFLDMGLMFKLTEEELSLIKKLLLTVYLGKYEQLYDTILDMGEFKGNHEKFKQELKEYCKDIDNQSIAAYYTKLIYVFIGYNILVPEYFFKMAKAFVCLDGICMFSDNNMAAQNLLKDIVAEYMIKKSMKDCSKIVTSTISTFNSFIKDTIESGIIAGATKQLYKLNKLQSSVGMVIEDIEDISKMAMKL